MSASVEEAISSGIKHLMLKIKYLTLYACFSVIKGTSPNEKTCSLAMEKLNEFHLIISNWLFDMWPFDLISILLFCWLSIYFHTWAENSGFSWNYCFKIDFPIRRITYLRMQSSNCRSHAAVWHLEEHKTKSQLKEASVTSTWEIN